MANICFLFSLSDITGSGKFDEFDEKQTKRERSFFGVTRELSGGVVVGNKKRKIKAYFSIPILLYNWGFFE